MNRTTERVFIDTNMLLFAVQYNRENIFSWFNKLYGNIWIHVDVLDEMLLKRQCVQNEIDSGRWHLFNPLTCFSVEERVIYNAQVEEIKTAFQRLNNRRTSSGKRVKNTANTGEISTLAVCLIEDAHLICSNDFDIRDVVCAENYTYIDYNNREHLIVQDTAEDFCFQCVAKTDITKAQVRRFYKTLFECPDIRKAKLASLDNRLRILQQQRPIIRCLSQTLVLKAISRMAISSIPYATNRVICQPSLKPQRVSFAPVPFSAQQESGR